MRILCVPNELPLPCNSGGRIDVWRRLGLLRELGLEPALLSWYDAPRDGAPSPAVLSQLRAVCPQAMLAPIERNLAELVGRGWHVGRLPSHVASRWVAIERPKVLAWARAFAPDLLLLDGLYGAAVVRWLAERLGRPWIYRSHNIEHLYMRRQWQRAVGWQARAGLAANLIGLERLERETVRDARLVLDISLADAAFWRDAGAAQVHWLPTVVDAGFASAMLEAAAQPPQWELLYFGNLNTPNNVEAVRWLVQQVLPLLGERPLRLALAGSRPHAEVRRLAGSDRRIVLLADPPSMPAVAGAARVLVNPVQAGSGVNLKSVEMLFGAAHLVSTPAGVQGLPADAAACFEVHAQAPAFAAAIAAALDGGAPPSAQALRRRQAARRPFGPAGVRETLQRCIDEATDMAAA